MVPNYNIDKIKHPFKKRLAKEHLNLHEFCQFKKLPYRVTKTMGKIPSEYELHYKVKSIIGIDDNQLPIYGNSHRVKISLPARYPMEPPIIYAQTEIWHPNIKHSGKQKGRVCGNTKGFGQLFDLSMLAQRIEEILEYKNYHAENTIPFPEDEEVARWVRDFAEPYNIINKTEGLSSEPRIPEHLLNKSSETPKEEPKAAAEPVKPGRKKLKIKRKGDTPPPPKPPKRFRFGR